MLSFKLIEETGHVKLQPELKMGVKAQGVQSLGTFCGLVFVLWRRQAQSEVMRIEFWFGDARSMLCLDTGKIIAQNLASHVHSDKVVTFGAALTACERGRQSGPC